MTFLKICAELTDVGVVRFVIVPSPSWPYSLAPQHFRTPELYTKHVLPPLPTTKSTIVNPIPPLSLSIISISFEDPAPIRTLGLSTSIIFTPKRATSPTTAFSLILIFTERCFALLEL
jgi:hypothetical protein